MNLRKNIIERQTIKINTLHFSSWSVGLRSIYSKQLYLCGPLKEELRIKFKIVKFKICAHI